jgi:hypothetical protein
MLRTWLTWLQSGVGAAGMAFVLSNALYASANPAAATGKNTSDLTKNNKQPALAPSTNGTTIDRELQSVTVSDTPDVAVRQLATQSMTSGGGRIAPTVSSAMPAIVPATTAPASQGQVVASTVPSMYVDRSATAVPGLFIGNSDVVVPEKLLPATAKTPNQVATTTKAVVTKYPAVAPVEAFPVFKSAPATVAAKPAPIPVVPMAVKTQPATSNSNPLAAIPNALKQIVGGDTALESTQTVVAKDNVDDGSIMAMLGNKKIQPMAATTETASRGVNLNLDTARAFNISSNFNMPGVKAIANPLTSVNLTRNEPSVVVAIREIKNDVAKSVNRQSGKYVAALNVPNASIPKIEFQQPRAATVWVETSEKSSNLGGLILGQRARDLAESVSVNLGVASVSLGDNRMAIVEGTGVN